jgi:hypothetical protein
MHRPEPHNHATGTNTSTRGSTSNTCLVVRMNEETPQPSRVAARKDVMVECIPQFSTQDSTTLIYGPPAFSRPEKTTTNNDQNSTNNSEEATHPQRGSMDDSGPTHGGEEDSSDVEGGGSDSNHTNEQLILSNSVQHNFCTQCLLLVALAILVLLLAAKFIMPPEEVYYDAQNDKNVVVSNKDFENTIYALATGLMVVLLVGSVWYTCYSCQNNHDGHRSYLDMIEDELEMRRRYNRVQEPPQRRTG